MFRRTSRVVAAVVIGFGILAGPLAAPSAASLCPPHTEWDPISKRCILIGP